MPFRASGLGICAVLVGAVRGFLTQLEKLSKWAGQFHVGDLFDVYPDAVEDRLVVQPPAFGIRGSVGSLGPIRHWLTH